MYAPAPMQPAPGTMLSFDINDQGRVGLGDSVGSSVAAVEGLLRAQTDSAFVINVGSVTYLSGQTARWAGEPIGVNRNYIMRVRERRFSRGRTMLATGTGIAAVVAFALTRDLFGIGTPQREPGTGPPDDQ